METTRKQLAMVLDVDARTIDNLVALGMPKVGRGRYDLTACVPWYVQRERAAARATKGLNDLDLARQRKTLAEAQEAEIRVARVLGQLVPIEVVTEIAGASADRMLAVLQNAPNTYALRLERQGMPSVEAEALLLSIADDLTAALRGVADQLGVLADADDESSNGAAVPASSAVA